jgi:DNA-binding HxlR family transcriptional regulator
MGRTTPLIESTDCRVVGELLGRIGDKWTVLIVVALSEEPHRFSALRQKVGGISQQMLSLTLKTLERDGMVLRTVYDTAPPQVSYELTELGRSLATTLAQLAAWSIDNLAGIEENRRRYDGQRSLR